MRAIRSAALGSGLAAILALSGFGNPAAAESDQKPVKVGVLTDMNSIYSDITGMGSVEAARMAAEDAGEVFGRPVQVIFADNGLKPDQSVAIARRWYENEDVDVILDLAGSSVALAVNELTREKKKIMMASGAGTTELTGPKCSPYTAQWTFDTYALAHSTGLGAVRSGGDTWFELIVDQAYGYAAEKDLTDVIIKNGGKVLGVAKHPLNTSDFSSFLLQAQASGAKVVGLGNAGNDMTNSIKQAAEFGLPQKGQKLVGLLTFITDVYSLGLKVAQGLLLTESFYWDMDDETRAWSERYYKRMRKMPSMDQAGVYSAMMHYIKAVILARRYESHLWPLLDACAIRPGEVIYTCMPLFHASGLLVFGTGSIRRDAQLALGTGFSASAFWDECRRYGAVCANVFGVMIPYLLKQPPRPNDSDNPMRSVLSVGCPKSAWVEFEQRFKLKVVEFYGASDAPGFLVNSEGQVGSVGKPAAGAEFRIVDDKDNELPPGKVGEIIYRHPAGKYSAYNNLPDVTAHTWRGGWYHSGDIGETDEDGFFYFHGRMKEAIRRRGENISAWEISSVLDLHPKVQESAAFGVPSEEGEEEVMVSVVPQPNATVTPEELLDFCHGRLAYYAMPRYVDIVRELPKTSTQKIQHLVLKARGRSEMTWDREQARYVVQRA